MDDRFRAAARAYFGYGVVYAVGGTYLFWAGVGRGSRAAVVFVGVGWILTFLIPYLLRRRRGWFERWVLSRRDFARIVAVIMAVRIVEVVRVAVRSDAVVAAPWGGVITYRAGGAAFALVTAAALFFVARAAWTQEQT